MSVTPFSPAANMGPVASPYPANVPMQAPMPAANAGYAQDAYAPQGMPADPYAQPQPIMVPVGQQPQVQSGGGGGLFSIIGAALGGFGAWKYAIPKFAASAGNLAKGGIVAAGAVAGMAALGWLKNKIFGG